MNAVVTIEEIRIDRIAVLLPECTDPDEAELRERLLIARDIATAAIVREWDRPAAPLLVMMSEIAGGWAFAPASIERLREAREVCLDTMRLISRIEALEAA